MQIEEIFKEYGIELDDIRWFLSRQIAGELLAYQERPEELTYRIWSKSLEDSLYNMEERFLTDLQEQLEKRLIDEAYIRGLCLEALALRRKR